jgi:hypothetical protein
MDNQTQIQVPKAYGPIIGIIIVIAIFIAGGVYLFTAGSKKPVVATPANSEITVIEKDLDASLANLTADINLSDIDLSMGK